jgi:hypothetical protein
MNLEKKVTGSIKTNMSTRYIFEIKIERGGLETSHFIRLTREEEEFWSITFKNHNSDQDDEIITMKEIPIKTINDVLVLTNLYDV